MLVPVIVETCALAGLRLIQHQPNTHGGQEKNIWQQVKEISRGWVRTLFLVHHHETLGSPSPSLEHRRLPPLQLSDWVDARDRALESYSTLSMLALPSSDSFSNVLG